MKKLTLLLFLFLTFTQAQNKTKLSYYLPQHNSYNQSIPTPESVIGHQVGDWHITHDKLAQYMYALADASDRITIENRGTTFEGRPLLLLTITTPENHSRLESIRQAHIDATENNTTNVSNLSLIHI